MKYPDKEIWEINKKFLDIQIKSGKDIYLAHNPMEFLKKMQENGYNFVKEGELWHAIR